MNEQERALFEKLLKAGIKEMRGGQMTLHFDTGGRLAKIETRRTTYRLTREEDE